MKIWGYTKLFFINLFLVAFGLLFTAGAFVGIPILVWSSAETIISNLLMVLSALVVLTVLSGGNTLIGPLSLCAGLIMIFDKDAREDIVSCRKQSAV